MAKIYLAGGIQFATNGGKDWRNIVTKQLDDFSITVLDPTTFKIENEYYRRIDKYSCVSNSVKNELTRELIMAPCMKAVRCSDAVLCLYDESVQKGAGTICEVWEAYYHLHIPVYIINTMDKQDLPGWLMACTTEIFRSIGPAVDYICKTYSGV